MRFRSATDFQGFLKLNGLSIPCDWQTFIVVDGFVILLIDKVFDFSYDFFEGFLMHDFDLLQKKSKDQKFIHDLKKLKILRK